MAAAAGVSVGTVSNVLNRPHQVSEATRERVETAIADLGFVRNESARQLRSGASRAVGMIVIDSGNPFFADVTRGAEDRVHEAGGVVLVGSSAGQTDRERQYLELFEQQRVRGLLVTPTTDDPTGLEVFRRLRIPVVLVDRVPEGLGFSSVSVDDVEGGRLVGSHLVERGHRRLCFVGGPDRLRQIQERSTGFRAAVAAVPEVRVRTITTGDLTLNAGRAAADQIAALPAQERPEAVFAANDLLAIGLLQGLLAHGLRVPTDVALVGYDDIDFAAAAAVPLSSVRQPREELGRRAAEILYQEIVALDEHRPAERTHVRFAPELVERASTARP
ncbi:MAG TPA: LacI family DNA-binding transcriptional regulator [Cellulomonas sp.]